MCPTLYNPTDYSLPGSSVHGFSRQEYWNGLPFPSPEDIPDSGTEPGFPALQADSLPLAKLKLNSFQLCYYSFPSMFFSLSHPQNVFSYIGKDGL